VSVFGINKTPRNLVSRVSTAFCGKLVPLIKGDEGVGEGLRDMFDVAWTGYTVYRSLPQAADQFRTL